LSCLANRPVRVTLPTEASQWPALLRGLSPMVPGSPGLPMTKTVKPRSSRRSAYAPVGGRLPLSGVPKANNSTLVRTRLADRATRRVFGICGRVRSQVDMRHQTCNARAGGEDHGHGRAGSRSRSLQPARLCVERGRCRLARDGLGRAFGRAQPDCQRRSGARPACRQRVRRVVVASDQHRGESGRRGQPPVRPLCGSVQRDGC
jgi:hypothetical protein